MYLDHEGNRTRDISQSWGQPDMRVHIRTIQAPNTSRSRGTRGKLRVLAYLLHSHYARVYTEFVQKHTFFFSVLNSAYTEVCVFYA